MSDEITGPKFATGGIVRGPISIPIGCVIPVVAQDAESTSAALARVERERDEALAEVKRLGDLGSRVAAHRRELAESLSYCRSDLDLARAELASAQQELDALRTVRDQLGRDVTMAHATIGALKDLFRGGKYSDELCPRCGIEHQLELAADAVADRSPRSPEGEPS